MSGISITPFIPFGAIDPKSDERNKLAAQRAIGAAALIAIPCVNSLRYAPLVTLVATGVCMAGMAVLNWAGPVSTEQLEGTRANTANAVALPLAALVVTYVARPAIGALRLALSAAQVGRIPEFGPGIIFTVGGANAALCGIAMGALAYQIFANGLTHLVMPGDRTELVSTSQAESDGLWAQTKKRVSAVYQSVKAGATGI